MTEPNQSDAKLFINFLLICLTIVCLGVFWLWVSGRFTPTDADLETSGLAAFNKADYDSAFKVLRRPAENGSPRAQFLLGFMYSVGNGVSIDRKLGAIWYRKAANQGYASAQLFLGIAYEGGDGVPRDTTIAYFWYLLASSKGEAVATEKRDEITSKLSPTQKKRAQSIASIWKPNQAQGHGVQPPQHLSELNGLELKSEGVGFAVTKTALVSNARLVANCDVVLVNGVPASIKAIDARFDLAVINVTHNGDTAKLNALRIREGDAITTMSYRPNFKSFKDTQHTIGNIRALNDLENDSRFIQISGPLQNGNTETGPLLDNSGNIVGLIYSKPYNIKTSIALKNLNDDLKNLYIVRNLGKPENSSNIPHEVYLATSPIVLQAFLDANGIEYQNSTNTKSMSTADVADVAKKYTSLVECYK
jgi:uncharacterized protein